MLDHLSFISCKALLLISCNLVQFIFAFVNLHVFKVNKLSIYLLLS